MSIIQALEQNPVFLYLSIGVLGLLVGSFLNVVIYRLPIMLQKSWRQECLTFLEQEESKTTSHEVFNYLSHVLFALFVGIGLAHSKIFLS